MASKDEIERIIAWCEKTKKERGRIYVIERNPFTYEISWAMRFPLIEIDRPREVAAKTSLVYDSLTKSLWQFVNGTWARIQPDLPR